MAALLETRNLSKNFGAVTAAYDLNVTIEEGEVVGIIGANGAGKTTFINIITGYVKPSHGNVRFMGREITSLPPRKIIRMGICRSFQIPQLFTEMTVWENLMMACTLLNNRLGGLLRPFYDEEFEKRVERTLERFNMKDYRDEVASALPQGIKKLLDVAMAVMGPTKLLLLDEPTSGVAIEEKFPLMDTIMSSIEGNGTATIFIEHDMEVVQKYATRVIAFYDGRIIADGSTDEVMRDEDVISYVTGTTPSAGVSDDDSQG